jgi:hypothetical protein
MRRFNITILLIASVFLPVPSVQASVVLQRSFDAVSAAATHLYEHQAPVRRGGESPGAAEPVSPAESKPTLTREDICQMIEQAANEETLPLEFFSRLIWQESKFDPFAVSPVGAQGIAQFMPRTANGRGLSNPFDALPALFESAEYLGELRRQFGNLGLAAAAYNAGPKRVQDWLAKRGGLSAETRNYVRLITGHSVEAWTAAEPPATEEVASEGFRCNDVHKLAAQRHRRLFAELIATVRAARAEQAAKLAQEKKQRLAEAAAAQSRKGARGAKLADRAAARKGARVQAKEIARAEPKAKSAKLRNAPLNLKIMADSASARGRQPGTKTAGAGRTQKVARIAAKAAGGSGDKKAARKLRLAANMR